MMMCSCRSKSKVVFLEVSRYEGQLPRVDGVEVGLPRCCPRWRAVDSYRARPPDAGFLRRRLLKGQPPAERCPRVMHFYVSCSPR